MNGFYDLFAEFADELTKYDRALKNAKVLRLLKSSDEAGDSVTAVVFSLYLCRREQLTR